MATTKPIGRPRGLAGRSSTPAKEGEKATLGIRASASLKRALDLHAKENGRSLSAEAELRLERSFEHQRLFDEVLDLTYGPKLAALLRLIGRVLIDTGPHAAAAQKPDQIEAIFDWLPNAFAFDQARRAVELVFDALRPEGDLTPPNPDLGRMGEQFARGALVAIKDHEAGGELGDWAKPIRERLGALVDRINA